DVYGEVLDAAAQWAFHLERTHGCGAECFDRATQKVLIGFARYVAEHWQQPDEGIWEPRTARQHHTFSRVLCWAALDRVVTLAEKGMLRNAPLAAFRRERARIACDVQ